MFSITANCHGFITCVAYKEHLLLSEFESLVLELNSHIKDKRLYVLTDLRNAKLCTSSEDVYAMEKINRLNRTPGIIIFEAILVRGVLEKSLTLFFNKTRVSGDHSIKIFTSETDAIAWLRSYEQFTF